MQNRQKQRKHDSAATRLEKYLFLKLHKIGVNDNGHAVPCDFVGDE